LIGPEAQADATNSTARKVIPLRRGRQLVILEDAGNLITKLPKQWRP